MSERSRAATWAAQADNDAAHAHHSAQAGFYAQACYSAQKAVEKALKSLLLTAGQNVGRTHSVLGLCRALDKVGVSIPSSIISRPEAQELTRMNIETRYPLGDAEDPPYELFSKEAADRAIDVASRVVKLALHAVEGGGGKK